MARGSGMLITYALGSCIGICLYDKQIKLGALIHIMLPVNGETGRTNTMKYANTGIRETLKQMVLKPNEGRIELDILSDIASVEIFVNQGALSAAFYHLIEKNTPSVTISVEGGQTKLKQLTIHELNSMYVPQ